jgi:glycosyltransferase involved in cell wall biosynthesis
MNAAEFVSRGNCAIIPGDRSSGLPRYVLITPARNEADYIELTIRSVVAQTWKPLLWVIVSDGSKDGTDEIVRRYLPQFDWLRLVRMPEHTDRHFAAKVTAFNAGYAALGRLEYDVIGNLDADVSFGEDYFEFLLCKLCECPRLGVFGTPFTEHGVSYDYRYASETHVSGACQLFRRACFEDIGGYTPIRGGTIDWLAVTTARMKGWETRTIRERTYVHHRPMGTGGGNAFCAKFKQGRKDYFAGGHPVWQTLRALHQMRRRPYLLGGTCLLIGYAWAALTRMRSPIPQDVRLFHRREQAERLQKMFSRQAAAAKHRGE